MAGTKPIHLRTPEEHAEFRRVMNELVVRACNEGGHNSVAIDLVDLLDWLAKHHADLIWKALGTTVERFRTELTTDPESMDGQTKAKAP